MDPQGDRTQRRAADKRAVDASRRDQLQRLVTELERTLATTATPKTLPGRSARAAVEAQLGQARKRLHEPEAFPVDLEEPLCMVHGCLEEASLDSMSLDETWLCDAHRSDLARTVLRERIAPDPWLVRELAAQVVTRARQATPLSQTEIAEQALELAARMTTREDSARWDMARAISEARSYPGLALHQATTDGMIGAAIEAFQDGCQRRLRAATEDALRSMLAAPSVPRAPAPGRPKGAKNRKGSGHDTPTRGTVAARRDAVASILGRERSSVTRAKQKRRP